MYRWRDRKIVRCLAGHGSGLECSWGLELQICTAMSGLSDKGLVLFLELKENKFEFSSRLVWRNRFKISLIWICERKTNKSQSVSNHSSRAIKRCLPSRWPHDHHDPSKPEVRLNKTTLVRYNPDQGPTHSQIICPKTDTKKGVFVWVLGQFNWRCVSNFYEQVRGWGGERGDYSY